MKILAVVDVHPLGGRQGRGLFARVARGRGHFALPITRDQATILLSNVDSLLESPSPEEENVFADFAGQVISPEGTLDAQEMSEFYIGDDEDDSL